MTLQAIRRFYEEPVEAAAATLSVPFRYENQLESGGDAYDEFMTMRVNYGNISDPTLCGPIEVIRGSLVVEYYGPKGIGTARAQEVMTAAARALCLRGEAGVASAAGYTVYGTVLGINGPLIAPLSDRPYLFASLSSPITARLGEFVGLPPLNTLHTRVGDVVAVEGDYDLDQMGDVDITTAAPGEPLQWDGTNWVPTPTIDSSGF